MYTVYFFSGLGADERAFQYLDLGLDQVNIHHIKWVEPLSKEDLTPYAKRLAANMLKEDPIFIGLSFGGIMAIEVAKFVNPRKIILIASAKTYREIPFYFRWAGLLRLHRLTPLTWLKKPSLFNSWLFGARSIRERKLLKMILQDTDAMFLKWAIQCIIDWKNIDIPVGLTHIHGEADRILPIRFVKPDIIISDGGHLMTIDKAKEISQYIRNIISNT
ncbi:alpha/beta hydrolase [Olivibacter sp. 47]|uniref:alpha/beta hydrolase n=1 Tax=Olivibacter sp. 47 TaxID=3056486 RepID=UPI0025A48752|nr:alpha/beta hydrolase [Olivibacter sp. 47]MDM8173194.1 alpha/beta hydrolase [Olivibacter sp. 47]